MSQMHRAPGSFTHICSSQRGFLVIVVELAVPDNPGLLPWPPAPGTRMARLPSSRHRSIKLGSNPVDLDSLGHKVAPEEAVPLLAVAESQFGFKLAQDGVIPFVRVTLFFPTLAVLFRRRDRFVSGCTQKLGHFFILEVVNDVVGRAVKVAEGVDSGDGEDHGRQYHCERNVGEQPGLRSLSTGSVACYSTKRGTHSIGRRRCLDKRRLCPSLDQEHRHSGIHAQERIRRIHESFLLVWLSRHDDQPEVEPGESEREEGVWAALAWLRLGLGDAETTEVEPVGDSKRGKRQQGKREGEVEVQEQVGEVECRGFRAV